MRQARDRQGESFALSDSNPGKSVANIFRHRSSSKRGHLLLLVTPEMKANSVNSLKKIAETPFDVKIIEHSRKKNESPNRCWCPLGNVCAPATLQDLTRELARLFGAPLAMSDVMRVVVDSAQEAAVANDILFLSPHIRDLATSVYEEFKNQVARHGEGAVDGLAPIVIRILERVDELHEANEVAEVRLGILQTEVRSLNLRVERETSLRKAAEARVITLDDEYADTKSTLENHITELSGLVRILQTKHKNAAAHATRLEEKEAELRKELANAQVRYNDLLRTHVAHIERCRRTQQQQQQPQPPRRSRSKSQTATDTTNIARSPSPTEFSSLANEFVPPVARAFQESELSNLARKEMPEEENYSPREIPPEQKPQTVPSVDPDMFADPTGFLLEDPSDFEAQLIGQSLTEQNDDTEDLISTATADECDEFGMNSVEYEVNRLVVENQDLIETKNALNVLKDDLLTRIDDLTGENIVLRHDLDVCLEELNKRKMQTTEASRRIRLLEAEVARLTSRLLSEDSQTCAPPSPMSHGSGDGPPVRRSSSLTRGHKNERHLGQDNEQKNMPLRSQSCSNLRFADGDYTGVPAPIAVPTAAAGALTVKPPRTQPQAAAQAPPSNPAQLGPKTGTNAVRFTRREMARVVVERNYYKRKFLELQETVQYSAERHKTGALQQEQRSQSRGSRLSSFASSALNTFQSLASDVVQGFEELFSDASIPPPSTRHAPVSEDKSSHTRTSTALWNLLGNFVNQAVTYTADAVISTGSGLLRDVARPMITADVRPAPRVQAPKLDDLPPGCIGRATQYFATISSKALAKICDISRNFDFKQKVTSVLKVPLKDSEDRINDILSILWTTGASEDFDGDTDGNGKPDVRRRKRKKDVTLLNGTKEFDNLFAGFE
ncbi:MAP-kinase scaffold activity [Sparganum proliferum]